MLNTMSQKRMKTVAKKVLALHPVVELQLCEAVDAPNYAKHDLIKVGSIEQIRPLLQPAFNHYHFSPDFARMTRVNDDGEVKHIAIIVGSTKGFFQDYLIFNIFYSDTVEAAHCDTFEIMHYDGDECILYKRQDEEADCIIHCNAMFNTSRNFDLHAVNVKDRRNLFTDLLTFLSKVKVGEDFKDNITESYKSLGVKVFYDRLCDKKDGNIMFSNGLGVEYSL